MTRFIWAVGIVAAVALIGAGALVAYALASPRGLVGAGGGVPPYFVLLDVIRGWLPVLVIVGLGAAVCVLFALAVQWNRTRAGRSAR